MKGLFKVLLLVACLSVIPTINADVDAPPPGVVAPNDTNSSAGVIGDTDDDMQPNPNPLNPYVPLTPSTDQTIYVPHPAEPTNQPNSATPNTYLPQTQQTMPQPSDSTFVPGPADTPADNPMMEQCKVVDRDGNGLIKAYMADSGPSLEGDASAWIWVPVGQCEKINRGDFSGVSAAIRSKINPSDITDAQTID